LTDDNLTDDDKTIIEGYARVRILSRTGLLAEDITTTIYQESMQDYRNCLNQLERSQGDYFVNIEDIRARQKHSLIKIQNAAYCLNIVTQPDTDNQN
jgi:hypothetical protein